MPNNRTQQNALAAPARADQWQHLKRLVLDSVSSPITRRVYNLALDEFFAWFHQEPRAGFTKATVNAWRSWLDARKLGTSSIIVRLAAIRKLAVEAADNGLVTNDTAAAIRRVRGVKYSGVKVGNWLSLRQAQDLLAAPDAKTLRGVRDRAILAVLVGCGLRRSEVASLTLRHFQRRDGRWCIVDLKGKHGRIRTVPVPAWTMAAVDKWTARAGLQEGHLFRGIRRGEKVGSEPITEKMVWHLLRDYASAAGLPEIAPHDLRRTCAKLSRAAGGDLEQIQMLLGHASVQTTERYLGTKQDLVNAPNDRIRFSVPR
jgi:site-specific recombinase XerD